MKHFKFFILSLLFFVIILASCKDKPLIIDIDNPTNKKITFYIDSTLYKMPAFHFAHYNITEGEHKVKIDSTEFEIFIEKDTRYLLNPTLGTYFIQDIVYGSENYQMMIHESLKSKIDTVFFMVDSSIYVYAGSFDKREDILIEKNWDFDIIKKVPNSIKLKGQVFEKTFVKIFRARDFVAYTEKEERKAKRRRKRSR